MAYYKDTKNVNEGRAGVRKYDTIWSPGEKPKYPGKTTETLNTARNWLPGV